MIDQIFPTLADPELIKIALCIGAIWILRSIDMMT